MSWAYDMYHSRGNEKSSNTELGTHKERGNPGNAALLEE